jgi:nitrogen fixation NifU-like protein
MPTLVPTETLDRFETIELLQAYYQHPPHYGNLSDATISLSGHTPGCSDQLTLYIRLSHTGQRIEQVHFEGAGCTISQAAAALLCERVAGMLVSDLATLDVFALLPELDRGVLVSRIRCATLALGLLKVGVASAAA